MKVEKVIIKEFKILENFEQDIKGNHVLIMGDNGVGKSTLIQFMEIALGKQTNIPPGAKGSGEMFVNKDGKIFTFGVKFKDGKPIVTITSPEGLKDTRKGTLATITGAIDFDIDEFADLSKSAAGRKKQVEIFKSFLSDDVKTSLANYQANIDVKYQERTDLNRLIKEKEGFVKSHRLYPVIGVQKFEHKDFKSELDALKKMQEENKKRDEVLARFTDREKQMEATRQKIKELNDLLETDAQLQSKADTWLKENKGHEPSVIAATEKALEDIEKTNRDFTDAETLEKEIKLLGIMAAEAGEMTAQIDSSKEAIANTVRDMEGPIEGLGFNDEMLVYNNIPVNPDSLSTSEIMELGMRLKMSENKDFGILFLQRAESIGKERFKRMLEIADKAGWQIIAEQVERGQGKLHVEIMTEELIST